MRDRYKPTFGEPITDWVQWFAWKPVDTVDGGWAWLKHVHRRRIQLHEYLDGGSRQWWQHTINPPKPKTIDTKGVNGDE